MRTGQHIVGVSAAGVSAAMAPRRAGFVGEVVVVGAERHPLYERPPLRLDRRAQAIDPSAGTVLLDDGEVQPADARVA